MPGPIELPRHPVVRGHPVHAMLSDLPVVLIPGAFLMEGLGRIRRKKRQRDPADAVTKAAFASAAAAGIAGWVDWLTMPSKHPAFKPATLHGLLNSAGLVALARAVVSPRTRFSMLSLATGTVVVAAWFGGEVVFRHGWRVRPAEEAEIAEQQLDQAGIEGYFERARTEVAEFERSKTFLAD